MKCTNCGFETNENIQFCPVCGTTMPKIDNVVVSEGYNQQKAAYTGDIKVNNYLTLNVVFLVLNAITLCLCCGDGWILIPQILVLLGSLTVSIIGVVFSIKVNKMLKLRNIQAAMEASKVAKSLFFIGMILFIIKLILAVIGFVIIISAAGGFEAWWQSIMDAVNHNLY